MGSEIQSNVTHKKSKLARTFAKVLSIRSATGITPVDGIQRVDKLGGGDRSRHVCQTFDGYGNIENVSDRAAMEALLAKLFASLSSVKSAYAQLQFAQFPYDADGIQSADRIVVSELKVLSEVKKCYLKKQFDSSPETTLALAEIQELKSLVKGYEIMGKKLESQMKFNDSEIEILREKLDELNHKNSSIDKRSSSNSTNGLSVLDNLNLSSLSTSHFVLVLRSTIKSIRSFVKVMVNEMESAGWDIDNAVTAIESEVIYRKTNHKCFAFESFVCRKMFDSFHHPNFSITDEKQLFLDRFLQLKSMKGLDFITQNPKSEFARFVRHKFTSLVHPKMELQLFGDMNHSNLLNSSEFPVTPFFGWFVEMAKYVWLLHCLAFSFEQKVSIFQVRKNCRFSEVYMECVVDEPLSGPDGSPESDPSVAFTVFPGFRIGKTVIQCLVYI